MSLYPPPEVKYCETWTTLPESYRRRGEVPAWAVGNKNGQATDSFLEGPSFDRDGNLYVTDIPYGRIFRISPSGDWSLVAEYDGWPNGLKIHRDGRIFVTDYKRGIMRLDPDSGRVDPVLTHRRSESFRGVNDLVFDSKGTMYFTDQGQTGMHDPTGRVYRYNIETGALDLLITNAPSPNGLVLNPEETTLYVAVTRGNGVWRVPLLADGGTTKVSIFTSLAGGISGADGMAVDWRRAPLRLRCRQWLRLGFHEVCRAGLPSSQPDGRTRHNQSCLRRRRQSRRVHYGIRDGYDSARSHGGAGPGDVLAHGRPGLGRKLINGTGGFPRTDKSDSSVAGRTCHVSL